MMRFTLDFDRGSLDYPRKRCFARAETDLEVTKAYYNILHVFPHADIRVDLTRNGNHMVVWVDGMPQSASLKMRKVFGDDPMRIMFTENGRPALIDEILWTHKGGGRQYAIRDIKLV